MPSVTHSCWEGQHLLISLPASIPAQSKMVKVKVTENSGGLFFFSPERVSVKAGSTILWINREARFTRSRATTGKFKSKNCRLGSGVKDHVQEGWTYKYHCIFHSSMTGKIVVHK